MQVQCCVFRPLNRRGCLVSGLCALCPGQSRFEVSNPCLHGTFCAPCWQRSAARVQRCVLLCIGPPRTSRCPVGSGGLCAGVLCHGQKRLVAMTSRSYSKESDDREAENTVQSASRVNREAGILLGGKALSILRAGAGTNWTYAVLTELAGAPLSICCCCLARPAPAAWSGGDQRTDYQLQPRSAGPSGPPGTAPVRYILSYTLYYYT